ncbi:MAG: hypothetical protein JST26_20205 [Bacteroidetes bacterium]|nr:hypothetical protein [Bacteroidota bacterium]
MKRSVPYMICLIIGYFANTGFAQTTKPPLQNVSALESFLKFEESQTHPPANQHLLSPKPYRMVSYLPCIGYSIDLPFFCQLESDVHKHTNLWIKVRTGNDESYMKMISVPAEGH